LTCWLDRRTSKSMPRTDSSLRRLRFGLLLWAAASLPFALASSDQPHWIRITSTHFSVATDADEKRGHDVVARFEQMRSAFGQLLMRNRINMSEPVDIIALRRDDEYAKVAPIRPGQPIADASFFIPGADRDYFVLNVSKDDSWRAISHDFAHVLLNYNYPQTQAWFDEGFAEYFSSLRMENQQVQIGGDPEQFTALLSAQAWLAIPDLFTAHPETPPGGEGSRHTMFNAQSWIVMHYLLSQSKLSETGAYFDLVQNHGVPVEQAIQKAYGMTSAQFAQAVKDYFHSLTQSSQAPGKNRQPNAGGIQSLGVTAGEEIGASTQELPEEEGQSLVAEMSVRLPERREQAMQELEAITGQAKTDNVVARRGLAWAHLQKKEYDRAVEELSTGADLNIKDPWLHYYLALVKYDLAQSGGRAIEGLPNMMQDLRLVLNWDPEFAEARRMLAMAQLQGGGVHAATDSIRAAIQLNPRSQSYVLNLAQIYLEGKDWDAASALLERLKTSPDAQVAKTAREQLESLPTLKKYGVLPHSEARTEPPSPASPAPSPTPPSRKPAERQPKVEKQNPPADEDSSEDHPDQPPAPPQPDKRAIQYLKGKLMAVDCSQAPSAILTVSAGPKVLKLRTEDYKALMLIGADNFSCEWTSVPVSVNYRAGGKADGDLVSVELE
jgi:tetratricopeptide (TPR) repeat protein